MGKPIPSRWLQAIDKLDSSAFARKHFGDRFVDTYVRMKRAEERKFHARNRFRHRPGGSRRLGMRMT